MRREIAELVRLNSHNGPFCWVGPTRQESKRTLRRALFFLGRRRALTQAETEPDPPSVSIQAAASGSNQESLA
jgi:hypothetical protein